MIFHQCHLCEGRSCALICDLNEIQTPCGHARGHGVHLRGAEPENLAGPLERIREAHHLPALAAAAVDDGVIVGLGAAGLRRANGTGWSPRTISGISAPAPNP